MQNNIKSKNSFIITLFVAIEAIFCFTPIGSIPIGPIVASLFLIPPIIASLTFGKNVGLFMGLVAATFSFIVWTFVLNTSPTAFLFTPFSESAGFSGNAFSIIICFIPRIIAGFIPGFIVEKYKNKNSLYIAAMLGSITNTTLVLFFIYLFFREQYARVVNDNVIKILLLTILTNGIPECILSTIVCPKVSDVLTKIRK